MAARQRILVIANPTAGSRFSHRLELVVKCLRENGGSPEVHKTKARGDAERLVTNVARTDFDVIAVAGGDGTINEVLNGLPKEAPPVAILPLGTTNVLAEEIAIPRSIEGIAKTVVFGPNRLISLGEVNGRRFAMMASVGFDAEVVDHVDLNLKRYIGKSAYLYETVKQLAVAPRSSYRLRIHDRDEDVAGVIIANGRYYGGRFVAAPTANLEKPSFVVCRLMRAGLLALPGYMMSMLLGRLAEHADIKIDEATDLELLGPSDAPLQADGDILCRLPATVRILPAAANLVFPVALSGQTAAPSSGHSGHNV